MESIHDLVRPSKSASGRQSRASGPPTAEEQENLDADARPTARERARITGAPSGFRGAQLPRLREGHVSDDGWAPADAPRRPVLFVNPRSGAGRVARTHVVERAHEREIEVIVIGSGQDLARLVEEAVASGADALGMAGGDGSLAVVAAVARAHELPFVCVPAGTRNHFALDLGLDREDPSRCLDALEDGVELRVDLGNDVIGPSTVTHAGDVRI